MHTVLPEMPKQGLAGMLAPLLEDSGCLRTLGVPLLGLLRAFHIVLGTD